MVDNAKSKYLGINTTSTVLEEKANAINNIGRAISRYIALLSFETLICFVLTFLLKAIVLIYY